LPLVTSTAAGQEPVPRHDGSGKPSNGWDGVLTARYSGGGTCANAGHRVGLGTGQLPTWSSVECWTPHSVRQQVPPGLGSTKAQPQRWCWPRRGGGGWAAASKLVTFGRKEGSAPVKLIWRSVFRLLLQGLCFFRFIFLEDVLET
jgi:hypothetical protein